jgi:hypothetical protein
MQGRPEKEIPMRFKSALGLSAVLILAAGYPLAGRAADSDAKTNLTQEVSKLKTDCKGDVERFCKSITPGQGRVFSCLDSHEDQLSPICRSSYMSAKARVSERLDQEELAFRDSCGGDISRFCSKVPSGRGRLLDCLDKNKSDLSPACQDFQKTISDRLSSLIG